MRLGLSSSLTHQTPEEWAGRPSALGCRAVNFPADYTCDPALLDRYARAAQAHDLVIAEVGAWCNPISPDPETKAAALLRCKEQLRLADRLHARCCVNVSGSKGSRWDGPYRENMTEDTWQDMIRSIQEIIDDVNPQNTFYTIEPMPWMYPMGPDEYLRLIRDVNRERFAVHMDVFNWITSAQRYFFHEEFMEECFTKLGTHIKSCHLKNVHLSQAFTLQLQETACEKGDLHLEKYAQLIEHLDPDMPVIIEHLESDAEYLESLAYVIQRFHKAGYSL